MASLRPGATDESIFAAEREIGVCFPEVVRESYRRHDGQLRDGPWLLYGREFLSLERLVEEWRVWKDLLDGGDFDGATSEPDEFIRDDWWSAAWIPLTYDGCGNHDCLDLAPTDKGLAGQIIDFWHDSADRTRVATGFHEWLSAFAADMESGEVVRSPDDGAVVRKDDV